MLEDGIKLDVERECNCENYQRRLEIMAVIFREQEEEIAMLTSKLQELQRPKGKSWLNISRWKKKLLQIVGLLTSK